MMNGREIFRYFSLAICIIKFMSKLLPRGLAIFLFDCSSSIPTRLGAFIRYVLLCRISNNIGNNVYVGRYCIFKNVRGLSVGNNVSLHDYCYVDAKGGISIGDEVSIAHGCSLLSFDHVYVDGEYTPIKYKGIVLKEINIERDVWIGCGCRILCGSQIKTKVVVAANSVVKGTLESGLYAGSIAKKIKDI